MKSKQCPICIVIVVAAALIATWTGSSSAVQPYLKLGKLTVVPDLAYRGEFNDNIFYESALEEDDFIHTFTPSLRLKYDTPAGTFFAAGYLLDLVAYQDFTDNNYHSHDAYLTFRHEIPAGFYFRLDYDYLNTGDPYGTRNQYGIGEQTWRWNHNLGGIVGYKFYNRYRLEGAYQDYRGRFDAQADLWQDRIDNVYRGRFYLNVTGKSAMFLEYRRTDAEYDRQHKGVSGRGPGPWSPTTAQDYHLNDFMVGARFEPGGKLLGEASFGYGEKNFENRFDKDGNPYRDTSDWVADAQIYYQLRPRTRLTFLLERSQLGAPDADASSYVDTLLGLRVRQRFRGNWRAGLAFAWNNNDYLNVVAGMPDKTFDRYTLKAEVEYKVLKWLVLGLEYQFENKTASDPVYDLQEYQQNMVAFSIKTSFDWDNTFRDVEQMRVDRNLRR